MRSGLLLRILALFLLAAPVVGTAKDQARVHVNTLADFLDHTTSHIERVVKLGMYLFHENPELFGEVNPELLREYLSLHDQAKVNPRLSRSRAKTFARELYENYGKTFAALSSAEKNHVQGLVTELNATDARVGSAFLAGHGLVDSAGHPSPIALKMLLIEKVADQVDRGLSPVSSEEFAKTMQPASRWMSSPEEKRLAESLEAPGIYPRVTNGSSLPEYQSRYMRNGDPTPCLTHELQVELSY